MTITPVKQTILHDPPRQNGNCFAAVIASVTHIPIEEILPIQDMFDLPDWHIRLFCWLKERGWLWRGAPEFQAYFRDKAAYVQKDMVEGVPYLVIGKTTRFDGAVDHVCVYMDGKLIHDPHPDNTGLLTEEQFEVIEPIKKIYAN